MCDEHFDKTYKNRPEIYRIRPCFLNGEYIHLTREYLAKKSQETRKTNQIQEELYKIIRETVSSPTPTVDFGMGNEDAPSPEPSVVSFSPDQLAPQKTP